MHARGVVLALALSAVSLAAPIRLAGLAQGKQVAFEVASIKRNASGDENFGFNARPGGLMVAINVTPRQIVRFAFSMQNSRVEGGPEWMDTEHYDITAKAAEAATPDQMLLMFRTLLTDRFKLVLHMDARDTPIFTLVRARTDGRLGAQLRPSSADCDAIRAAQARGAALTAGDGRPVCGGRARAGIITAGGVTMEEVARNMSGLVQRVVVDRTGLQGRYDFDLKFVPDAQLTAPAGAGAPAELPSLFVALEEQLGLKLEAGRAPVDVVVIDSIARPVED
jgi:uncharacterized protein (TIGR03435 family)